MSVLEDHSQILHQTQGAIDLLRQELEHFAAQVDPDRQSNATVKSYVSSFEVKGARARLFGLTGYNAGPSQFIHIYDLADLPADGAVPTVLLSVAAASSFALDYGVRGRRFTNGIVIAASTTGSTKTLGTASLWLDVQYD